MDEPELRQVVEQGLAPLLSASVAPSVVQSTPRHHLVSYWKGPNKIAVKLRREDSTRLVLERSQAIEKAEKNLASAFIEEVSKIDRDARPFASVLMAGLPLRVIAKHVGQSESMLGVLEQLERWSGQTYEGRRIAGAFGLLPPGDAIGSVDFPSLVRESFAPLLSNGFDSLIVLDHEGRFAGIDHLPDGAAPEMAPYRLGRVAAWATNGKVGASVTRNGEILVFQDTELRFARRNQTWTHFAPSSLFPRMTPPMSQDLRKAIYASCLDASFARTGACVGVLRAKSRSSLGDIADKGDILESCSSTKARLFSAVITDQFHRLDRRLRQEIMALDGATILDHKGTLLAVGAIIKIEAGSTAGGRLAAARKLGTLGLGLKVSSDGLIRCFRGEDEMFSL